MSIRLKDKTGTELILKSTKPSERWMSVGLQFLKTPNGWRVTDQNEIDLTNWSFEYRKGRIVCRPMPLDFIFMAIGTVILLAVAIGILTLVFKPAWLTSVSSMGKSKVDSTEIEEVRLATEKLKEQLLKEKTPEERELILRELDEAGETSNRLERPVQSDSNAISVLYVAVKLFGVLVAGFFGLMAMTCLRREILFFRDKIVIKVVDRKLQVSRPTLFNGMKRNLYPLNQIGPIVCQPIQGGHSTNQGRYVVWTVQLLSRSDDVHPLVFKVDHDSWGPANRPTAKTKEFIAELQKVSRIKFLKG